MKRILMIALALVTVLSLVACGGSKEKAKNETVQGENKVSSLWKIPLNSLWIIPQKHLQKYRLKERRRRNRTILRWSEPGSSRGVRQWASN